jgi:hypothetical protein
MARSTRGVPLPLLTDPDDSDSAEQQDEQTHPRSSPAVDSLVSILDTKNSLANHGVLLATLQTLEQITLTPAGRQVVARTPVLDRLEAILGTLEPKQTNPLLGDDITTKVMLQICGVINNIALDGEGKRNAAQSGLIVALAQAMAKAVDTDNLEVIQIAVRAITMILIIEDSKRQLLKPINAPKKHRST